MAESKPKRGPGRPVGSKSKKSPLRKVEKLFEQFVPEAVLEAVAIMKDKGDVGDPNAIPPRPPRPAPKPETKLAAAKLIIENYRALQSEIIKHENELKNSNDEDEEKAGQSTPTGGNVFTLNRNS